MKTVEEINGLIAELKNKLSRYENVLNCLNKNERYHYSVISKEYNELAEHHTLTINSIREYDVDSVINCSNNIDFQVTPLPEKVSVALSEENLKNYNIYF